MATDQERLQILIEGKVNDFEKATKRVERSVDRMQRQIDGEMRQVQRSSSRAARAMSRDFRTANREITASFGRLSGAARAGLAGLGLGVGALGIGSITGQLRQTASAVAALGDQADKVGVTVEQIQALRVEFEKTGVSSSAFDQSIQRFSRRVGEAAKGTGTLAKDFQALGINVNNADGSMRPLIDIFADYAQAIKEADSQQEALRLSFQGLGREGAGMVNLMRSVGSEVRTMANSLNGSDAVFTSEDVRKAREVDAALIDLNRELDIARGKVALALGPAFVGVLETVGDIATGIAGWSDGVVDVRNELDQGVKLARSLDEAAQRAVGGMSEVAENAAAVVEEAAQAVVSFEEQRAKVEQLAARLERANELAALAEADGAVDRLERLRAGAARLEQHFLKARDALFDMQNMSISQAMTAPPGIGPIRPGERIGAPGRGDIDFLSSRTAHGNVSFDGFKAVAAAGAAEVLRKFPGLQVTSAYRSAAYNASVGGATNSRHIAGDATDVIGVNSSNVGAVVAEFQRQGFRGFGYYNNGMLHADMGARRAWGPGRTGASLGQTPRAFQDAVLAGPQMSPEFEHSLWRGDLAAQDQANAKAEQERLELLRQQNAERERQQAAIDGVNESLARQLEMAGLEADMLQSGLFTQAEVNNALNEEQLARQKLNELRAAGVQVSAEMEEAIRAQVAELFELRAAADDAAAAQWRLNDSSQAMGQAFVGVGQPIMDTLFSIIDGSQSAEDAIRNLIKQFANLALQGLLFGQGPLGNLFGGGLLGGLFPGRAAGGPVTGGNPYIVGERGPELFMPGASGQIMNNATLRRLGTQATAGGPMNITVDLQLLSRFAGDDGFRTEVEKVSTPIAKRESRQAASAVARRIPAAVAATQDERDSRRTAPGVF